MTPEMYTIIAVGVSNVAFLSGLMVFLFNQVNRRIDDLGDRVSRLEGRIDRMEGRVDRLEESLTQRIDRLEDKIDRLQEQMISLERQLLALEKRVSKLEWMLDAALYGKPVTFPPEPDADSGGSLDEERPT